MNLSPHFTLSEAMASAKARAQGIDNTPPAALIPALTYIAVNVLEPIRAHYGVPLVYDGGLSWYRSPALNAVVDGVVNSQHLTGEAVDIEVPGITNIELAYFIRDQLRYDELGLENWDGTPQGGWVHVGASAGFKGTPDVWTYRKWLPKAQRYSKGLPG